MWVVPDQHRQPVGETTGRTQPPEGPSVSGSTGGRTAGGRGGGPAAATWSRVRASLWPLPVLGILLAVGLGVAVPALDGRLTGPHGAHPLTFVFGGGPSAARDLLAVIAGSLISVTGLTFSLTVVALQLGSSQYSPRLLQTFVTDRVVQLTLAQLVATFVYALTVLRTVRTGDDTASGSTFVPRLSITLACALTLVSVLALVLFLGHLAQVLRVETMLRDVHDEGRATFEREVSGPDPAAPAGFLPGGRAEVLSARSSGFLVGVDVGRLLPAAEEADAVVLLAARIGDSVVAGTPIGHVWLRRPAGPDPLRDLGRALDGAVRMDFERSPEHDIAYSLRKIVDIVVRALSPAVNDPTTAVHALSHVSALLADLAGRPLRPAEFRSGDGTLRVVVPQWGLADLVRLALEEPLQVAAGQPAVLRRVADLLREFVWTAPAGSDALVRGHLDHAVRLAEQTTEIGPAERSSWRQRFEDAVAGRWPPVSPPEQG
jgi:uncharacterized membrane protein